MKKTIFFLTTITITFILIFLVINNKLNINTLLKNIEKDIGIHIDLQENQKWSYYPFISYNNNLHIYNKNKNFIIENSTISIIKNYRLSEPFVIKFSSPSIKYKGTNFRNSQIDAEYKNKLLQFKKLSANVVDGKIDVNGYLYLNDKKNISLEGAFDNISLNRILKQLSIADWERVKIKLSSPNFVLNSIIDTPKNYVENLNGEIDINGSVFFVSTEEEKFGAAFLSLLADRLSNMLTLSKSIRYLLDKFADIPSNISGKINIANGVLTTEKLKIDNKKGLALLSASLDLKKNLIDGKIDLYENNKIFLTTQISGSIDNPKILINGKNFLNEKSLKPQNIKEIFEDGIQSIIDNILNTDD